MPIPGLALGALAFTGGASILGITGNNYRKTFEEQSNSYRTELSKKADEAVNKLTGHLTKTANRAVGDLTNEIRPLCSTAQTWLPVIGCASAFAQTAYGVQALYQVYEGLQAQQELQKFHSAVEADLGDIKNSLSSVATDVHSICEEQQESNNHKAQHDFPQHVYDFATMESDAIALSESTTCLVIYHPGNEWVPAFRKLAKQKPINGLYGIFDNLDIMATYLQVMRKVLGEKPVLHVLMPASRMVMVPDAISFPAKLQPLVLQGELQNRTGTPYNCLNMPGASPAMLRNVTNLAPEIAAVKAMRAKLDSDAASEKVEGDTGSSKPWGLRVVSNGAGAVVGSAVGPTACGVAWGVAEVIAGATVAPAAIPAGVVAAYKTGKAVKNGVEKAWGHE